jgi:ankyrin repeat protein
MNDHLNYILDSISQFQNEAKIRGNHKTYTDDYVLESKALIFSKAMKCAREGNLLEMIRQLDYYRLIYSKDFDINERQVSGNGRTLLQEASMYGNIKCVEWILTRDTVDVNKVSLVGKETALHYACSNDHLPVVLTLLQNGANPNKRNKWNLTAFDYCQSEPILTLLSSFRGGGRND